MYFEIIGISIYVKINLVPKKHKQLRKFDKHLLKKEFKRFSNKLLTRFKQSDTLMKLPKGDNKKQIVTAKVV